MSKENGVTVNQNSGCVTLIVCVFLYIILCTGNPSLLETLIQYLSI
jgi:hypothetical protein